MLVVRVRCVDDGRELLVERHGPTDEWRIQVAELKRLVLQQRAQLQYGRDEESKGDDEPAREEDALGECFVFLRGQILADVDVVNLFSLTPSDFFVFVQDTPQQDIQQPIQRPTKGQKRKREREATHEHDDELHQLQRRQLEDMGFAASLAERALRQSNHNLSDAVALLAEDAIKDPRDSSSETELDVAHATDTDGHDSTEAVVDKEAISTQTQTDLMRRYPSVAPLEGFMNDVDAERLRTLAATDSFQALLLLREHFSSRALAQLNENPVAALRFLSLPISSSTHIHEHSDQDLTSAVSTQEAKNREEHEAKEAAVRASISAIDRLMAMGFNRDLVEMMYESCGGDEQLTANALLETLDA